MSSGGSPFAFPSSGGGGLQSFTQVLTTTADGGGLVNATIALSHVATKAIVMFSGVSDAGNIIGLTEQAGNPTFVANATVAGDFITAGFNCYYLDGLGNIVITCAQALCNAGAICTINITGLY